MMSENSTFTLSEILIHVPHLPGPFLTFSCIFSRSDEVSLLLSLNIFFFKLLLWLLLAVKTSKAEDLAFDQSSGLTNSPNSLGGVMVEPAVSVLDGGFSADGDPFSVAPQSLSLFNEYAGNIRPFPSLPEDQRSGIVFHHKAKSSEEHSIVRQISTTLGPRDRFITTYSIPLWPGNPLSTIKLSEANTADGRNPSVDGRVQDLNKLLLPNEREDQEEARADGRTKSNPGLSAEGSGSGSGLYSNRLNQELGGVTTVNYISTLSTINFQVDNTGKKSRSTGIKMDSETDEEAGSKIIGKNESETVAEDESELSSEEEEEDGEGEAVSATGNQKLRKMVDETDESARQLNSTAGCDTLNDKERETEAETVMGTVMNSGEEIESDFRVFSRPVNIHGSGDGGEREEGGHGKGMNVGGDNDGVEAAGGTKSGDGGDGGEDGRREDASGRRDGLQLSVSQDGPTAELPLFDSSEEDGDGDEHSEDERNLSLDSRDVWGKSTLEDNKERDGDGKRLKIEGGGEDDTAAGTKESSQQPQSVDRLLFDPAKSPVLRHHVPLFTLTDGSKATDERMEGKCLSMLSFSSALPLCDTM